MPELQRCRIRLLNAAKLKILHAVVAGSVIYRAVSLMDEAEKFSAAVVWLRYTELRLVYEARLKNLTLPWSGHEKPYGRSCEVRGSLLVRRLYGRSPVETELT